MKHFLCTKQRGARPSRCTLPGKDVLGETPNTARGTLELPIPIDRFCQTNPNYRDGRADLSVAAEAGQRNCRSKMSNDQILMTNQCPNDPRTKLRHSSFVIDWSFVLVHTSLSGHNLIPSASVGINAKGRVGGLEKISECSFEDGLPSQAQSKWVKLGQTILGKG